MFARVGTVVAGLAIGVLIVGMALLPVTAPWFTRTLSSQVSLAEEAGLSSARMLEVAEQVRAFVVSGEGQLSATIDGRPAFDASAVSHLVDVRIVLRQARLVTGLLAAGLAVWIGYEVVRRRTSRVVRALRVGSATAAVIVLLAGLIAVSDFDTFFTAFHGLFFAAGTWTFPYDSLLIQLFPEPFWAIGGATWAGVVLLGAAACWALAWWIERSPRSVRAQAAS